jgi:hypothetical protein
VKQLSVVEVSSQPSVVSRRLSNLEETMQSKIAQWILWAIIMIILSTLAIGGHYDALLVALIVSSLVWYTVVPRTISRSK